MSTLTSVFSTQRRSATCLGCMDAVSSPSVHHLVSAFILFSLGQRFPSGFPVARQSLSGTARPLQSSKSSSFRPTHGGSSCLLCSLPLAPLFALIPAPLWRAPRLLAHLVTPAPLLCASLWWQHIELPFPCSGAAPPAHS